MEVGMKIIGRRKGAHCESRCNVLLYCGFSLNARQNRNMAIVTAATTSKSVFFSSRDYCQLALRSTSSTASGCRGRNGKSIPAQPTPAAHSAPLPRDNSFRLKLSLNSAPTGAGAPVRVARVLRAAGITAAPRTGDGG